MGDPADGQIRYRDRIVGHSQMGVDVDQSWDNRQPTGVVGGSRRESVHRPDACNSLTRYPDVRLDNAVVG